MTTYTAINLVKYHEGGHVDSSIFEVVEKTLPEVAPGQILVKQNYMSLDPAMFGWMTPDTNSYIPPVALGDVMRSSGIGEVTVSNHPDFTVGDRVMGMMGWQQYYLGDGQGLNKVTADLPDESILSVFALPGLTATQGLFNVGKPEKGETLIVTGAAGSVGSIVGQLAKADGLRVIGVVGSQEKADWIVNELGFDAAINYKSDNLAEQLADAAPDGIDVFFENTGGPIQHMIIDKMNAHGRVVVCGLISDYHSDVPAPGPSWLNVIKRRITIQGFTMPDHFHKVPALLEKLTPYVMAGQIKHRTHVLEGLESAIDGLNLFATGANKGKLVVKI
ncbi:NADP-dependent oxidoreductase [Psychromonas sp. 14N.309.X.WAT.B.A12]|uniref:NADP-dependent oxidoreductase n=1 Tax=unclassified Psychromonas TaxID=2614957 RepID=UPI0025B1E312|nr:NADP-dependent oxidoreductase [Psychromonas sp. 14N.309.X.WAT.B.A12]MDN2661991.1 NADP-dependent oxidoreductase [Psychromonas sp. 14N.309.X.WAT.B.A12]